MKYAKFVFVCALSIVTGCVSFTGLQPSDVAGIAGGSSSSPSSPPRMGSLPTLRWGGDLAGSSMVSQSVSGLTGSGGIVTASAGTLQFGTGVATGTIGTNKAGATLALQADAAANLVQYAGGAQNGFTLGPALATAGHMRVPNSFVWMGRNAANSADVQLFAWDAANQMQFGSPSVAANLVRGSAIYLDSGTVHVRDSSSTETNTLVPGAAYGMQITGGLAYTTRTVTGPGGFTVDTTTTDNIILADTSTAALTITLPAPTNGRELVIVDKKNTWGTHQVSLAPHGTEKIDNGTAGATHIIPGANGTRCKVFSDGTDWYTQCLTGTI